MIQFNRQPSDRQLRQFGCVALAVFPLVGWLWNANTTTLAILAGIGLALAIAGWLLPRVLQPLFVGLSFVLLPIGLVVGEVILLATFVLLFVPTGLVLKVVRRDKMTRRFEPDAETYWQSRSPAPPPERYYRQS